MDFSKVKVGLGLFCIYILYDSRFKAALNTKHWDG